MNRALASRLAAVVFVALLVVSPVASVLVPAAAPVGPASAAPDGFTTVPDTNVVDDLPVGQGQSTAMAARNLRGSVMASQDASSLQVIVTTPSRATDYVNGQPVAGGSGDIALVLRDNSSHAGRDVTLPADSVRAMAGEIPDTVHGVHENGTRWTSTVEGRNGLVIFHVPKFSSNTVTFEGEVQVTASPAQDGSKYLYDVGNPDSVSEFGIDVIGVDATETETVSSAALADGDTMNLEVAGTDPATDASVTFTGDGFSRSDTWTASGVSNGDTQDVTVDGNLPPQDAEVTLTGDGFNRWANQSATGVPVTGSQSISVDGNLEPGGPGGDPVIEVDGSRQTFNDVVATATYNQDPVDHYWEDPPASFDEMKATVNDHEGSYNRWFQFYIAEGDTTGDSNNTEGTKICTITSFDDPSTKTCSMPSGIDTSNGVTLQVVNEDGDYVDVTIDWITSEPPSGVSVTADDGASASLGDVGTGTASAPIDLSRSVSSLDFSATGGGELDTTVKIRERQASEDPGLDVNGDGTDEASYTGVLMDGETATTSVDLSTGTRTVETSLSSGTVDWNLSATERAGSEDPAIDVDGDGSADASHSGILSDGQTATYALPDLQPTDDIGSVSLTSGTVDVSVEATEHTTTRDPCVYVNGNETCHNGELATGTTTSVTADSAWIQDGQNNVTVGVGDGTLSPDAPTPSVAMNYTHRAEVLIDTTYVSSGWEESYNVSHTFPHDQENVTLTVPYSREIYEVEDVEQSVNGGTWQSVPSSDWEIRNGTELVVQLDDGDANAGVEGGDKIAVRTAGEKVNPVNGEITVTDPTDPSDSGLDTEIRVDSKSPGFHIEVGGTKLGDRVHYTHGETWENPDEKAVLAADGSQELYLPNAQTGGSARVTTIPLEVNMTSGDIGIQVADPDQPTIDVTPGNAGSGAEVEFVYYGPIAGEEYGLYSLPRERYLDKRTAGTNSVTLVDDDSEESIVIRQVDGSKSTSGVGGTGGGSGGAWEDPTEGIQLQEVGVVVSWAALTLLLVAATGRSELAGRRRWVLVAAVSGGSALLALELLRPGSIAGAVNSGLSDVVGLAGLAVVGLTVYSVYNWWQTRQKEAATPETSVSLNLGRSK